MEITWIGHSCFRIREKGVTVITDPYSESIGLELPPLKADIVTVSHYHPGHGNWEKVKGEPKVLDSPGEYEIKGVFITGIRTYHDSRQGKERGKNVAFLFDFENISICHLGDIGHIPDKDQLEALDHVDILLVPVGGVSTIGPAQAAEIVRLLEPAIVIPMHYSVKGLAFKLNPVEKFFKELGISTPKPIDTLKVTGQNLPSETQFYLMERKA
jgi:L-ascorbate metabolism protein UlaG (beta-lactamase superfamily)